MLNEITELRYDNELPKSIQGINRRDILRSYQEWKDLAMYQDNVIKTERDMRESVVEFKICPKQKSCRKLSEISKKETTIEGKAVVIMTRDNAQLKERSITCEAAMRRMDGRYNKLCASYDGKHAEREHASGKMDESPETNVSADQDATMTDSTNAAGPSYANVVAGHDPAISIIPIAPWTPMRLQEVEYRSFEDLRNIRSFVLFLSALLETFPNIGRTAPFFSALGAQNYAHLTWLAQWCNPYLFDGPGVVYVLARVTYHNWWLFCLGVLTWGQLLDTVEVKAGLAKEDTCSFGMRRTPLRVVNSWKPSFMSGFSSAVLVLLPFVAGVGDATQSSSMICKLCCCSSNVGVSDGGTGNV
ncbi:hypothetical protein B0H13DRAFT_1855289 [Mycena leptocephala]|nr:hypothetical protein B0H13DRAFT_1855289 [Mycena leptocephala]